ncbi:MAG: hypothetical protein BEN19_06315 [Epulopiscium sp. Nuni2H_MBin003]|nr:MAG: hypothetical protein BEN19_06315 [Epulopiscium sp. Nuni2H_MBin003]
MAGIAYDLLNVLSEQKECYEGLYTLATYKAQAVVEKDIDFLKEIVKREEEFVGRTSILNRKRIEVFRDIAIVTGLSEKNLTVSSIVDKMGVELEISQKLMKVREEILEVLDRVKQENENNKILLAHSMEFVDYTLNAIQTTRLAGIEVGYSKPGYQAETDSRRVFDAIQ